MDFDKGKKNKLNIGQKVIANQEWVDWHSSRLSWSFGAPVENDSSYSKGQREIRPKDFSKVYFLLHAKLSGKPPNGVVVGYGLSDDIVKGRNCVRVIFTSNTDIGKIKYGVYCWEDSLKVVKKKKGKK